MSKVIPFPVQPAPEEEVDLSLLDRDQLLERLARLREQIAQLNAAEKSEQRGLRDLGRPPRAAGGSGGRRAGSPG